MGMMGFICIRSAQCVNVFHTKTFACTGDNAGTAKKKQKNKTIFEHGILRAGCRLVEVPCHGTVCLGRIKETEGEGSKQNAVFMHLYQDHDAKTDKDRYLKLELNSPRALSEKRLNKRKTTK